MGSLSKEITRITTKDGFIEFIGSTISRRQQEQELGGDDQPFYVLDLGAVVSLYHQFISGLPMIHPHYAVKCNPEPAILEALADVGSNFDCASPSEIDSVLALGVSPDRIVYANPCKPVSHIKHAARVGVTLSTFDSVGELSKIRKWHPDCELLIRIKSPVDGRARWPLDSKFGADPEEVLHLLQTAQASGLPVIGVAFHIGSEANNLDSYRAGIAAAKAVFEIAAGHGMTRMRVLDVGGGFASIQQFQEAASIITDALQDFFPNEPSGLSVISEPGRFFAESAFTLATKIIGKRVRREVREYWINDGKYGSFACISSDEAVAKCTAALASASNYGENLITCKGTRSYKSTVFGPTCDALDTVFTGQQLPVLDVGDWLVFSDMGAYTTACGTNFNGFNTASIPTYLVRTNLS